jgi:hypothetical protein
MSRSSRASAFPACSTHRNFAMEAQPHAGSDELERIYIEMWKAQETRPLIKRSVGAGEEFPQPVLIGTGEDYAHRGFKLRDGGAQRRHHGLAVFGSTPSINRSTGRCTAGIFRGSSS